MKKDLVKKSNSLTEAYYSLSVTEYRVLHMVFSALSEFEVNKEFYKKVRFTVRADDYMQLFNVDRATAYQALKDASERLFNRYFTYDEVIDESLGLYERMKARWVQKIGYIEKSASITLYLTPDVLSMVGQLKEKYTYFQLCQMADLSSIHAIRIYEMLMQWRSTKTVPSITIEELRDRLGIQPDEYPRMYDFKKRVLDYAVKIINENTDIIASYEQQKSGRHITGFVFKFKPKPSKSKNTVAPKRDPNTVDIFTNITDAQIAKYSTILCKLGSISDLSNFPDYPSFANWIAKILRDPESANSIHAKRIFKALQTETDFKC
ncbi:MULTISPECIES: replication initiation protein RepM [unclassified Acinetobacter]|uniref:replication initiation protein RepM n=1 Tax=unclassified Acinetobacter TaxID=196816 RepID=UPI002577CEAD|nr:MULTISPECIES: replication initiation protein RepM [unclassified Acinetobacter]MDM1765933.1 replication initiation protein [Acinetobacter sp. 226-1]MDM1769660.1 replication initiation protein [Acinetobacter sp. 226-4]